MYIRTLNNIFTNNGESDLAKGSIVRVKFLGLKYNRVFMCDMPYYETYNGMYGFWAHEMELWGRQQVVVIARRWFQKTYGNTYHSLQIIVDGKTDTIVPETYGYGSHYIQTFEELISGRRSGNVIGETSQLPVNADVVSIKDWCQRCNTMVTFIPIDVELKRELEPTTTWLDTYTGE